MISQEQIETGQEVYSPNILKIYDIMVLSLSNRFIWKSKKKITQTFFDNAVTNNHLDVGVGTGYFLDHCQWQQKPRIGLMDLNENCLQEAKKRLLRYNPEIYCWDVFQPIELENKFDSCSMNFLFHCLPGSIKEKLQIINNLKGALNPGSTVFGTTVLYDGVKKSFFAEKLMRFYNKKGIFSNYGDSLSEMQKLLPELGEVEQLSTEGCVCFFKLTV
ncbi:class I SAM-dependent methyltransferase [Spartinivicinus poritis]|uniref:Class I SAM-dependent methyltransferase n=1 Tax=Spartinivicinus poritis TaxID=2994640 RepID=A0ABT5U585_9GAMM|nr:class I SAM-dependent methyltransferase [Spartinivicinus sp. A2-2]MDE1461516.1 class I SAM-dependent methyltransferase [Spartinivicinus sp. A2-2]